MNLKVGNGKVYKYEPSEGVCMVVNAQCILVSLPFVPVIHRPPTTLFNFFVPVWPHRVILRLRDLLI